MEAEEVSNVIDAILSGWVTEGEYSKKFSKGLRDYLNMRFCTLCNSGSSANLLAVTATTQREFGNKRARPGSEFITAAVGFPTTVSALIQNRITPVFVDIDPKTLTPDPELIEQAVVEGKTKGIILAHTLGSPFDVDAIRDICNEYGLWMIEDNCFVANTLVPTKNGTKHISEVAIGDKVLGFNGKSFLETEVVGTASRLVPQENVLAIYFEGEGRGKTVRCTKNHRFFVKGAWVRADQLKVGDEVYHATWSEYVSWRRKKRDYPDDERKRSSERMKNSNPMKNPDVVVKAASSRRFKKLSHIEKRVIEVVNENNLPIRYTGDFSFWVGDKESGRKNPDFLFEERKIVYEVYDPTFRYDAGFRGDEWKEDRARHYARFGYRTVFLPLKGWINSVEKENIAKFLRSTISNGIKIKRIAPVRNANTLNLSKEPKGYIRVYDIKCSPHHNFCLTGGILVHNCDSLGSRYRGELVGTQGTMSTLSLFPAHHITSGQGGAVFTNDGLVSKVLNSLVSWGRDCWCKPGFDNTCGKRFDYKIHNIEYDHKYIFGRLGYNLQITDLQSAIGVAQLAKIGRFEGRRKSNWKKLREALDEYHRYFLLPEALPHADPSWFGFHLTVKSSAPFTRREITQYLENKRIGTRMLFGGNLLNQPAFHHVPHKVFGTLLDSDALSTGCFWVGVHQGVDEERLDYMISVFREYLRQYA